MRNSVSPGTSSYLHRAYPANDKFPKMNNVRKEILRLFLLVVSVNLVVEWGVEGSHFAIRPIRFFGGAVIVSIIGGYLIHWVKTVGAENSKEVEDSQG